MPIAESNQYVGPIALRPAAVPRVPLTPPPARVVAQEVDESTTARSGRFPFALVVTYVVLEYGRPQQLVPALAVLHLPFFVTLCLAAQLLWKGVSFAASETKLFAALVGLLMLHVPLAINNYWAFNTAEGMLDIFVAFLSIITFVDSFARLQTLV